jgi:hypothetical protein
MQAINHLPARDVSNYFSAAGMTGYPRAAAAGGRKAPRHEIA